MKDRRLNQAQAQSGISVDMYRNSHSDAKKDVKYIHGCVLSTHCAVVSHPLQSWILGRNI
jgi:hypothetical protein